MSLHVISPSHVPGSSEKSRRVFFTADAGAAAAVFCFGIDAGKEKKFHFLLVEERVFICFGSAYFLGISESTKASQEGRKFREAPAISSVIFYFFSLPLSLLFVVGLLLFFSPEK